MRLAHCKEDEEEVVFAQRAKLYQFTPAVKKWKEKGVGDLQILSDKANNTHRILLRKYDRKLIRNRLNRMFE